MSPFGPLILIIYKGQFNSQFHFPFPYADNRFLSAFFESLVKHLLVLETLFDGSLTVSISGLITS